MWEFLGETVTNSLFGSSNERTNFLTNQLHGYQEDKLNKIGGETVFFRNVFCKQTNDF